MHLDGFTVEVKKFQKVQPYNLVQEGGNAAGSRWRKGLFN